MSVNRLPGLPRLSELGFVRWMLARLVRPEFAGLTRWGLSWRLSGLSWRLSGLSWRLSGLSWRLSGLSRLFFGLFRRFTRHDRLLLQERDLLCMDVDLCFVHLLGVLGR